MRLNTSRISTFLSIISMLVIVQPDSVLAQSSQYKRKAEPKVSKPAATKGKATKQTKKKKATNQKLDLEDLEKRYWAPKDTEFKVVQNRKFKKAKRYNVTLMGGLLFNDPFIEGTNLAVTSAYYFDEHNGIEVNFENYSHAYGEGGQAVLDKGGAPDVNFEKYYLGASYTWIPFYGKISVLDKKIIYFDLAFSAGLGMINYEQQTEAIGGGDTKNAIALNLDVSQQYFIHKNWSVRLDVRTKIYNEDRVVNKSGVDLGSKTQVNTYIMLGATYFH